MKQSVSRKGFLHVVACATSSLVLFSCATLRLQTIADRQLSQVRLARTGDEYGFALLLGSRELELREKTLPQTNATMDGTFLVANGTKCLILEETHKRCKGLAIFTKVRILEGPEKDAEGWVCGAFVSHRKVAAL